MDVPSLSCHVNKVAYSGSSREIEKAAGNGKLGEAEGMRQHDKVDEGEKGVMPV